MWCDSGDGSRQKLPQSHCQFSLLHLLISYIMPGDVTIRMECLRKAAKWKSKSDIFISDFLIGVPAFNRDPFMESLINS